MSLWTLYQNKLKTYIMLLCVIYLLVMLIFHLDIQESEAGSSRRPRFLPSNHTPVPVIRPSRTTVIDQSETVRLRRASQPVKSMVSENFYDFYGGNLLPDDQVRHVVPKPSRLEDGSCIGPDDGSEFEFAEVLKDRLFVYSAYWDTRPNDFDNRHNGSYVRMMAMVWIYSARLPPAWCSFRTATGQTVTSPIHYYQMCENHGRPFGGYILSCRVPSEISSRPCSVSIARTVTEEALFRMKVVSLLPRDDRQQFAICVPPLYGKVDANKLAEFIELSQLLGAQRIVFYDYQVPTDAAAVLEHYQNKGVVDVIPWYYPYQLEKASWYHGQMMAIQDCLYRNMPSAEYLAFNDLDEFVVPRVHPNWAVMMEAMFSPDQCAFQFSSAFFPPVYTANDSVVFASWRRIRRVSEMRTKCMVKPQLIFEKGIHHVSKPIWAYLQTRRMPEKVAFVHHYRSCIKWSFEVDCRDYVDDRFMKKYANKVKRRLPRHLLKS